jgi:CheY-like chemotaxis protein
MTALRILLVDDEKMLLALLKRHLERSGHSVVDALSAELALSALDGSNPWQPDVLVADQTLPGEPGSALAHELLTRFPLMRCLLCSGYPLSLDVLPDGLRSRAAILQKPYMPAALERALTDLMASAPPA